MNPQLPTPAPMAEPRQQVLSQIKSSTNVLLTVSENPTVDQLSAVIGMTLLLNKAGKHATAVFSGQVPSTIEFLNPEKTIEKTTDSLRDFIIALDKAKADKLRYKIEDKYVKIFITPYHTSLTEKDLEFSQGDFNVDLVLALGVRKRDDLDKTIIEHGRILHDATVISINNTPGADIGAINWIQTEASGLSEMLVGLAEDLKTGDQKLLDSQIATCFLTGIVAQTERFSNSKTTPTTMSLAAKLMNAGANQQLVASKLQPPVQIPKETDDNDKPPAPPKPIRPPGPVQPTMPKPAPQPPAGPPKPKDNKPPEPPKKPEKEVQDGALLVPHEGVTGDSIAYETEGQEANISRIHIDDEGTLKRLSEEEQAKAADNQPKVEGHSAPPTIDTPKPSEQPQPGPTPMSLPVVKAPDIQPPETPPEVQPLQADVKPAGQDPVTLSELEKKVDSPHQHEIDERPQASRDLAINVIAPDTGLPPDQTAGSANPSPPPPVPPPLPPLPQAPPPPPVSQAHSTNLSDPNTGVPM